MTTWYIARGTGLAALVLLTVSTCIGAAMSSHGRATRRVVWQYVHRAAASLGLLTLAVHLTAILADSYAGVGWAGALVPFTSGYRPTWVGLGSLAAFTFLLVGALGFARGRMASSQLGTRVWRGLHGLAYLGWAMAMLHGLKSGSDSGVAWVQGLYLVCGTAVALALVARVTHFDPLSAVNRPSQRPNRGRSRVLTGAGR